MEKFGAAATSVKVKARSLCVYTFMQFYSARCVSHTITAQSSFESLVQPSSPCARQ